jgi:hypothetical protein
MSTTMAKPAVQASGTTAATRFWIFNGACWFVFCITVWGLWITGPDFRPNHIGVDQASWGYVIFIRIMDVISILLAVAQVWYFIIRPKRRTGRLSFDGIFFLACWMLYMQEPWIDYNSDQFLYTTVDFNMGSWCRYVPGWNSPNAELIPVGSIIWCLSYLTLVGLWAYCGSQLMGWMRRRWPKLSGWQLIGLCYLAFIPADLILEHFIVATQLFNYASTVPSLTLDAGKTYQFPLYETVSWCGTLTLLASVHFFRNDAGETFAARGLNRIKVGQGGRTFLHFLAILGICQTGFFLTYNVPYFYWSTKGGAYPPYKEYKIAGLCGPGTNYDCPSLTTPLAKAQSPTNRVTPVGAAP